MASPFFLHRLRIFFEKYINVLKVNLTSIEKFFLFIYLTCIFSYLFINLRGEYLTCIIFKLTIAISLIIIIFFLLKKVIYYLLEDIENVFEESYFFNLANLAKKDSNINIGEFKNFKDFLSKKTELLVNIQNNMKDKRENLKILLLYPDHLQEEERAKIIEKFKDYFALFSIYFFRRNDNLKKILTNILIINLFIFIVIMISTMITHLKGKYFQDFGDFGTILIKITTLSIIVFSYFNFLINWNQKYNPSKIKNIYLDLKKNLYINIDVFTVYLMDIYFNKEQMFNLRQLLRMIEREINEKYIKTLEITLQLLLAISFIGALTIFSGLLSS